MIMSKQLFQESDTYELYKCTTHRCNLTGAELSTILYLLDDYIEGNEYKLDDPDFKGNVDRLYAEFQSITDNYFAQHEEA